MTSTCLSRDKIRSRSPDAGIAFHDRHLFHALLMLTWGSMFFEQLYRFDETANRFRRLACRAASRRSRSTSAFDQVGLRELR
jgi:hypothetical protein